MTPDLIWHDVFVSVPVIPIDGFWTHLAWQTIWFVPLAWAASQLLQRRCPAVRAWLWWVGCAQMLIVLTATLPALLSRESAAHMGLLRVLTALWAVGLAGRAALLAIQFRRVRCMIRECVPAPPCAATETATRLAEGLALRGRPTVLLSPRLKMPALAGLWRPALLLPLSAVDRPMTTELRMALAHELAHLRRRDLWLGLTPVLAQTVLFFHPLVWLAVREYSRAREEACDAEARRVTRTAPDEYGAMLMEYVTAARGADRLDYTLRSHFSTLQKRLNALRAPAEKPHANSLAAFCSVCVLGAVGVSVMQVVQPPQRIASGTPSAGMGHPVLDQLSQEFSEDTTYSQPIVLPPKHARPAPQPAVDRIRRVASAVTEDEEVATQPHSAAAKRRIAVRPPAKPLVVAAATRSRRAIMTRVDSTPTEGSPGAAPPPMTVASIGDTPAPRSALTGSDLETMNTTLKALRRQMKQKIAPKAVVDAGPPAKQPETQPQGQYAPQFQQRWKRHILELRVEVGSGSPTVQMQSIPVPDPPVPPNVLAPQETPPPAQLPPHIQTRIFLKVQPSLSDISPLAILSW